MIVDCFPFFDELDLLEIRVNELKDIVDVFVLTESPFTNTGIPKPLHFEENKERFKGFNIVHPVYHPAGRCSPIRYEVLQKQFNLDVAFELAKPGDIVAHGDADEIPSAASVQEALKDEWVAARFSMPLYYYYMNYRNTTLRTHKNTRFVRYDKPFKHVQSQKFKVDRVYRECGWHFSFMGDVQKKLEAFCHAPDFNKPPYTNPDYIKKCKEQGLDLFKRGGTRKLTFEHITDDLSYLPRHVLDNPDKFGKYIRRADD